MLLKDGSSFDPDPVLLQELSTAYATVNIPAQLHAMAAWLIANPTRRKTRRGMPRFINSWISRCAAAQQQRMTVLQAVEKVLKPVPSPQRTDYTRMPPAPGTKVPAQFRSDSTARARLAAQIQQLRSTK